MALSWIVWLILECKRFEKNVDRYSKYEGHINANYVIIIVQLLKNVKQFFFFFEKFICIIIFLFP